MPVHVTIRQRKGNEVVQDLGVMDERVAARVVRGASINLNHEEYYVDEEDVDEADE